MSREWKSGEVIFDPLGGLRGLVVETGPGCARHVKMDDLHVHYVDGDWDALVPDDARPLVVIDPENREQVERLAKCYRDVHGETELTDEPWSVPGLRMQAALREFANPVVKPEEPTAVGALVTDHDGEMWVRHVRGEWACLHSVPGKDVRTWVELVAQYSPLKIEGPA